MKALLIPKVSFGELFHMKSVIGEGRDVKVTRRGEHQTTRLQPFLVRGKEVTYFKLYAVRDPVLEQPSKINFSNYIGLPSHEYTFPTSVR